MARRRTSLGRQRIEIRRIEDEQARYVCFSKCRAGLFKKASELATLCGAEVAAVVFSPDAIGKAYSFGHPSVEAIIERFNPTGLMLGAGVGASGAGEEDSKQLVALNRRGAELKARLDAEEARKEHAEEEQAKASPVAKWLQAEVSDLGEQELMAYAAALSVMKAAVTAHSNQVLKDVRNHDRAMAATARACSYNIIKQALMAPLQQFFLANHGAGFLLDHYGAGSANNNAAAQMDMQIQQMMMMGMAPAWI